MDRPELALSQNIFAVVGTFPPLQRARGIHKLAERLLTHVYVCRGPKSPFFVAAYTSDRKAGGGGGNSAEGEDIVVLEMVIDDALAAIL